MPGELMRVQLAPPSRDRDTLSVPALGEVLASTATYTDPSGATATFSNCGCGSSSPVSGSKNPASGAAMISTGAVQLAPPSSERAAYTLPTPIANSARAKTVTSVPLGRTTSRGTKSSASGIDGSTTTGADQVAPRSLVVEKLMAAVAKSAHTR